MSEVIVDIENATIASLGQSGPEGKIKIVADNGKPFELRLSLNGFTSARDAMASLARQKAKTPPKTDAPAEPAPAVAP